ncbi:MAG: T9SS type A sorting domain-containing protein [Saprospiraceae bacterium]
MRLSKNTYYYLCCLFLIVSTSSWAATTLANQNVPKIYHGDVVLSTQAAIDAFSTYTLINGNLKIGNEASDAPPSDVVNLEALATIQQVTGNLEIRQTQLKNLKGLTNLTHIGNSLTILENAELHSFTGLNNLVAIDGALAVGNSPKLKDISALSRLKKVLRILFWQTAISSLEVFSNLDDNQYLSDFHLENCDELTSLKGLEKVTVLADTSTSILLYGNDKLTDISALSQLQYAAGAIVFINNPLLETCCAIKELVAEDWHNESTKRTVILENNAATCNDYAPLLNACAAVTPTTLQQANLSLYPNPSTNETTLDLSTLTGTSVELTLYNQFGQSVWERKINKVIHGQEKIEVATIAKGIYFLQIATKSSGSLTKKLIIKR